MPPLDPSPLFDAPFSPFLRKDGRAEALELVRQRRIDVQATTGVFVDRQPLHWCAYWTWPDVAREVLAQGAQVDAVGNGGETPLWIVSSSGGGDPTMVQVLLEAGANMDRPNDEGVSPWESILVNGTDDVVAIFQTHRVLNEQALLRATLDQEDRTEVREGLIERPRARL